MVPDILLSQSKIEADILNDTNYSINNPKIVLNPYKISPLTALVIFKTNDLASVTVTVKGKNGDDDITNTFVPSKLHLVTVYGLYPDYENTVVINTADEEKTLKIKTDALPKDISNASPYEKKSEDFYFTTSLNTDGFPVSYDKNGVVRWYLTERYVWDFTRLSNGYVLLGSSNLMQMPYYSSSLVEMDLLGKIYYEYTLPGGYHHDVYEKLDGNLIALSNDFTNGTKDDVIVEIDRNTGEVIKTFDLSKLFKNHKGDWISLNSVLYNQETNSILAVGKNKDMIVSIDYTTSEINWIIGEKNKIDSKYHEYLLKGNNDIEFPIRPQAITLVDEDSFAYINTKDGQNHLIIYRINIHDKTFEEVSNYDLGRASKNANVDYENGVFTITQDNIIKTLEKDKVDTVLETNNNLYSTKVTKMYAGDVYMTVPAQRLGATGITPTVKDHNVIIHKKDDSVFEKYNLKLSADAYRLTLKGTFKKSDNVQIILDNVLSKKTYDVNICDGKATVDNKMETVTYINKQGIYGKYYIYLKISGVNYKLGKFVMMS